MPAIWPVASSLEPALLVWAAAGDAVVWEALVLSPPEVLAEVGEDVVVVSTVEDEDARDLEDAAAAELLDTIDEATDDIHGASAEHICEAIRCVSYIFIS